MKSRVSFILVMAFLLVIPLSLADNHDLAGLSGDLGCCCIENVQSYDPVEQALCTDNPWTLLPPEYQPGGASDDSTLINNYCTIECPNVIDQPPTGDTYEISGTIFKGSGTTNPLPDAFAYLNIRGTTTASTTDSTGYFSIVNVPAQNAVLYLTHPFCKTQTHSFIVTDDNMTEHHLDCGIPSCILEPIDFAAVPFQIVPGAVSFVAYPNIIPPALCEPEAVRLKVCLKDDAQDCRYVQWNSFVEVSSGTSVEFDLGSNGFGQDGGWIPEGHDKLHIWISTTFIGLQDEVLSAKRTFPLGDIDCYYQSGSFCKDNFKVTCGGPFGNKLNNNPEECPQGTYCFDSGTTLECRDQIPCEECNSITSSFADIFNIFTPSFVFSQISCKESRTGGGQLPSSCALVATQTSRNVFERCENIQSCYDYTSELSCEGSQGNPCGVSGGCEWINAQPSILGKGICKPRNQNLDCSQCSVQFPESCDESFCNGLYDAGITCTLATRGETDICLSTDLVSCSDITTEVECIGPDRVESLHDILYSSQNPPEDEFPSGGTNAHIQVSNDTFGIGACKWDSSNAICYKDSDNNRHPDTCGTGAGDLNFLFLQCLIDTEPPSTTLFVQPNSIMDLEDLFQLNYIVEDNIFSSKGIETFFCLEGAGSPFCDYPNSSLESLNVANTGFYNLKFFSKDNSGNHEVIQNVSVFLQNVSIPEISEVRWVAR